MENWIILAIVLIVVGLAAAYVIRELKAGRKCIGCPHSGACGRKCQGCGGCTGSKPE